MCDEYILGDNSRKDVEAIRSALTDIGTLSLEEVEHKGGLLLRTYSHQQQFSRYIRKQHRARLGKCQTHKYSENGEKKNLRELQYFFRSFTSF